MGAMHGMTSGSMALSGRKPDSGFQNIGHVTRTPYAYCYRCHLGVNYPSCNIQCADIIEDTIFKSINPKDTAAIIIEPIQSDGGDVVPPKEWAGRIRRICDRYGILLVDEEIKVGFGRTGRMFAIEHTEAVPEIITVGKSIASGFPLSAVIAKNEMLDMAPATHLFTTAGNPICCAAALVTIEEVEKERLCERAAKIVSYMKKRLNEIAQRHPLISEVRAQGLILGLELVKNTKTKEPAIRETAEVCYRAWENGLILGYVGQSSNVVEITPPLILSEEDAEQGLQTLETTFSEVGHGKVTDEKITRFAGW